MGRLSAQEGGSTVCTCLTEVLVRGDAAEKGHNAEKEEQRCDTDLHFVELLQNLIQSACEKYS